MESISRIHRPIWLTFLGTVLSYSLILSLLALVFFVVPTVVVIP